MSKRDWKILFEDILQSINKIEKYTIGQDLRAFKSNDIVVDAVIRNFEIIGEAAKNVPPDIQQTYPAIPWNNLSHSSD